MKKIIIFALSVLIVTSGFQAVSAEIFFPSTNVRLEGPGTYCAITPTDEILQDKKEEWVQLIESAVRDWEKNLKDAEFGDDGKWDFYFKEISDNDDGCDVKIELRDQPNLSDTLGGYFSHPPSKIVIFYLQQKLCAGLVPCYDEDTLRSDDVIYAIAIHEIGHSLGLDHYVSDDNDVNTKWRIGNTSPPSVMITTIPRVAEVLEITAIDVQKVRDIYGDKGFYAFSDSAIPIPQPESGLIPEPGPTPGPLIPKSPFVSMGVSDKIVEAENYDRKIITLSGRVSEEEFHRGLPVIITIHKPDDSVEVLKITPTSVGYFETLIIIDGESIRGLYRISASYVEHVDKDMDVSFEVVDKKVDLFF